MYCCTDCNALWGKFVMLGYTKTFLDLTDFLKKYSTGKRCVYPHVLESLSSLSASVWGSPEHRCSHDEESGVRQKWWSQLCVVLCPVCVSCLAASPVASDPCDKFTLPALFHLVYCRRTRSICQTPRLMPSYLHKQSLLFYFSTACHMAGLAFIVNKAIWRGQSASGYTVSTEEKTASVSERDK